MGFVFSPLFQRAGARDEHGSVKVVDMYGGPLTFRLVLVSSKFSIRRIVLGTPFLAIFD